MSAQIKLRPDGSGVIHKLAGSWRGCVSAYLDANARLADAEFIPYPGHPGRQVKPGGPAWQEVQDKASRLWRVYGATVDELTRAAKTFGSADLYVGDDGLIYQY